MGPYLLVGVPRSGTSWTGETLGRAQGVRYVDEPDGFRDPFPFRVMLELGENPAIAPGASVADYERLWAGSFSGGMPPRGLRSRISNRAYHSVATEDRQRARAGQGIVPALRLAARCAQPPVADPGAAHVLVKSVQCARSVEWIVQRFEPRVALILRNPLNALASWRDFGFAKNPREAASLAAYAHERWGITAPAESEPQLAQQTFTFGVLTAALLAAADRHSGWLVVRHEELCCLFVTILIHPNK